MSKKITSIKLANFRAYPGSYSAFELNKGENLLIYGENGSGKSSLYKALNNFFASSIEPSFPFVKNRYCESLDGEVRLSFANFDVTNGQKIAGSDIEFFFSSVSSNHSQPFIQDAALVRGFLDYTDLLKVYLHSEEKPNLFELIVLQLLGNHIPLSSGGNFRFRLKWNQLQKDLNEKAYTRSDKCHKTALSDLPSFEAHLIHTLNTIFSELNRLLSTYFQELNIQLGYELLPLTFHYGRKSEWYTTADLRLDVIKDGVQIIGDYSDVLNEARLSAIAICLYLASLLRNPTQVDFKILYLDDVFIGLDAGNRIPILKIISNEFSAYQILISTYDRHWFELSKRYFEAHSTINWKTAEIYVGSEDIGGLKISKPIIVTGSSNYEQAIFYLHHRVKPDYPAAANYLRKALEELVQGYIPGYELTDSENVQLPEHKLTVLLSKARNFLIKTGNSCPEVNTIIGLLHTLLHPLSHHEINSPIYKGELIILETAYSKFLQQLNTLNIQNNYKCILEPSIKIKVTFDIDAATSHFVYYEIILKEPVILSRIPATSSSISLVNCYTEKLYGTKDGKPLKGSLSPKKDDPKFNYTSLENAVETIYAFLTGPAGEVFPRVADYVSIIKYYDSTTWQPLSNKLVW